MISASSATSVPRVDRHELAHTLRRYRRMNIRILNLCGILVLGLSSFAGLSHSQGDRLLDRREFAKLDVMARAAYFEKSIAAAAKKEGVDPLLLWTIAYNETRFRPWLTSPKNARGLMQFIPATAARFGLRDPYEPVSSIFAAARYVRVLSEMFDGRMDSILAAYNAGEGTVSAYLNGYSLRSGKKQINSSRLRTPGGVPPYSETRTYVRRGLGVYKALQRKTDLAATGASTPSGVRAGDLQEDAGRRLPKFPKVFYDPRSGKRLLIGDGTKDSLAPGPVIVSPNSRAAISASARTTFFRDSEQ